MIMKIYKSLIKFLKFTNCFNFSEFFKLLFHFKFLKLPWVTRSPSLAHNYYSYAGLCFFFAESGSLVLEIERRYRQTDDKRSNWPRITV